MTTLAPNLNPFLGNGFRYDPYQPSFPTIRTSVYQNVLAFADKRTDILNPTVPTNNTPDGRVSKQELLEARQQISSNLERVRLIKGLFTQFGGQYGSFFNQYFGAIEQRLSLQSQAARIMSSNFNRFKEETGLGTVDAITAASVQQVAETDGDALSVSNWDINPIYTLAAQPNSSSNDWQFNLLNLLQGQNQSQGNLLL